MIATAKIDANIRSVVPFLSVLNMDRSLRYYLAGLGFTVEQVGRRWESTLVLAGARRRCVDAPGIRQGGA